MDGSRCGRIGDEKTADTSADPLTTLVFLYNHIAHHVPPEVSGTAGMIGRKEIDLAGERLRGEIGEALQASVGVHRHDPAKTKDASALLQEEGLDAELADLLLETEQICYWFFVYELAAGRRLATDAIVAALEHEDCRRVPVQDLAAAAADRPTTSTVFLLLGRLLTDAGLPRRLFVELDLREMRRKPYLEDIVRGL
jgi:hypothetical protein